MITTKRNVLLWCSALVLILACVPTMNTVVPTVDPNLVSQFIAQTANAAASQTAAVLPTFTATETPTVTPEDTSTPSPTYTATVIFILSTPTRVIQPTATTDTLNGTSEDNYACQIMSVTPPNGSSFTAGDDFDTVWTVQNIGKRFWDSNSIDFVYDSGAKIHKVAGYDLSSNVKSGDSTTVTVDMKAPTDPGTYTTFWVLRNTNKAFCRMSITINVK